MELATAHKANLAALKTREPYRVFFDFDSAELTGPARKILDDLIADAGVSGPVNIVIEGHADRAGPASYNSRLSERRAEAVWRYLADAGLGPEEVNVTKLAYGEAKPMIETADDVRASVNRRAVIFIEE